MLTKQLAKTLQNLPSPGNYYATGSIEIFPPRLEVNQVGRISLPLLPIQAEQLISISAQAPYGKGYETLVDTDVRRTWQIDASQVNLTGKYWQKNLSEIVDKVKLDLGVECDIEAELYKLLVYDKGGFFVSHRDTEKVDSMFATLVIVLPSDYSGGELLVRHQQDEVRLDLHPVGTEDIAFAAFYADCVHEVLPITDGCRLTLIYNLIRSHKKAPHPTPPNYDQAQQQVASLLNSWRNSLATSTPDHNIPEKLVYLLEHEYSIAELKFEALKNKDKASSGVLVSAAKQADCNLYLALVSIEESGYAEHMGSGYHNHWNDSKEDDDYEIGEVFEHSENISQWRCPDGSVPELPNLPFQANEFCPPEAYNKIEFDDVEFQEATGNAGASFERMYHSAALVLWPRTHYLTIISQAGLNPSLTILSKLCRQWKNHNNLQAKQDAHTLATSLLKNWFPAHCEKSNRHHHSPYISEFLSCLNLIKADDLILNFWSIIVKTGIYQQADSEALAKTSKHLPWPDVVHFSHEIIQISAAKAQAACAALLTGLCHNQKNNKENLSHLSAAAQVLFASLAGDTNRFPELKPWQQSQLALSADEIADLIINFSLVDSNIAEKTLDYMLAWPSTYDVDSILLQAALQIKPSTRNNNLLTVNRLRQVVINHLQTRLAIPLEPPKDWNRPSSSNCPCLDCTELNQFLANPDEEKWRFKAAQARREHLQHCINSNNSDLDCSIDKNKRPYSLVCTKNQASYLRKVKQSQTDQNNLALLSV